MRRAEQLGPFRYVQSEDCFPLGQDTLLLAGFASLRPCWRVCDLGCGAGAFCGVSPLVRLIFISFLFSVL